MVVVRLHLGRTKCLQRRASPRGRYIFVLRSPRRDSVAYLWRRLGIGMGFLAEGFLPTIQWLSEVHIHSVECQQCALGTVGRRPPKWEIPLW